MTDQEMLQLCLSAFEAIPAAFSSKAFMKKHDIPLSDRPYGGPATYTLACAMQRLLREHLDVEAQP